MEPFVDTVIIRKSQTNITLSILFSHNYGVPIDPVNGTDKTNLNFTLFFSDHLCSGEYYSCGLGSFVPNIEKTHLQVGSALAQIQTVNITTYVLIPSLTCNDTRYLCVRLDRGRNSSYVDADDSNNVYCRNIETLVICQPCKDK